MHCVHCGSSNPVGSKFCEQCGSSLSRACPSCSNEVSPTAKFCAECGTSLVADASSSSAEDQEAEREPAPSDHRFVSVLFADIVAYTSFTEGHDSDEVREMLTVYFERSRAIIEQFGGTVEKYIGDAVFGVWGSELVREDDAERAVRAALELVSMVSALGEELGHDPLELRAGVMSGSATVGAGGNASTGMIVGDLVNTASRIQGLAEPSTVLVGAATHEVTERSITYAPGGPVEVKGKTEPVEVWRAVRPGGRVGTDANLRELPFVGRDREMRLLKDWLDATTVERRSRLVSVTGEAGIGKSRLAREFLIHVDGFVEDVYWHHGRSPSYVDGSPMWPLAEMLRQRAGIIEDDEPSRARTRLRTMLVEFVADQDDRQWMERWFSGLLGLGELPVGSRSELLSALRSFFQAIAERGTTILVFEDLHWADDGVVEFITELIDRSTRAPILLISLARPELIDRHAYFGSHQRASINVALAPLPDEQLRAVLTEHLAGSGAPGELVEHIVERASGFPLYAAEILRMLSNQGLLTETPNGPEWSGGDVTELAIPDTLQSVIGARLDRLEPALRSVLQDAAVLGLTFQVGALRSVGGLSDAVVDDSLRQLVRLDLLEIVDDVRSPERGQYRFVQGLIQELARDRLSRTDRRVRNLAAAEYFGRDDDPELAGVVAEHLMAAFELTPAGADRQALLERSVDGLIAAARRSAALHADRVAMDSYDRAIGLDPDDRRVGAWLLDAARCALGDGSRDRGLGYVERAGAWFGAAGDVPGTTRAAVLTAELHNSFSDSAAALSVIEPVYLALDEVDDELSMNVAIEAARAYSLMARIDEAILAADRALVLAEQREQTAATINLIITRSTALTIGGRPVEGVAGLIGAVELADRAGDAFSATRAANNLMSLYQYVDVSMARVWARRVQEYAERSGEREWIRRAGFLPILQSARDGDLEPAEDRLEEMTEETDAHWSLWFDWLHTHLLIARGAAHAADVFERFDAAARDQDDEQIRSLWSGMTAWYRGFVGDWQGVLDIPSATKWGDEAHPVRMYAAVRLNSLDAIADLEAAVEQMTPGDIRSEYRRLSNAVRLGMSGAHNESIEEFATLLPDIDRHHSAVDHAVAVAIMLELHGIEHPICAAAATELGDWFEQRGLWGYLSMWEHLLPDRTPRVADSAGA